MWPSRSGLSALPRLGDSILDQVFAGQSGAPAAPLVQQTVQQAIDQGQLWTKENCSGIPASSNMLSVGLAAGGSVAMKIAPMTGPAAPFVLVAAGVMQLFGALFGHHAAKVKQEQQIICAVVAACNDTFNSIDQLFQSGQISPAQASQALDGMYTQLQQNVQPILKQDSGNCNAACFILAEARGVIAKKKQLYQMAAMPGGTWQQSCRNPVVNGDQLTAECENLQRAWGPTTLPSIAACVPGSIYNANGILGCQPQPQPVQTPAQTSPGSGAPTNGSQPPASVVTSASALPSTIADYVNNFATQFGVPSWAIWGLGALLLVKVIE